MQLLKIELRGFKSFADKTTLTFDKGITAIVGPNGSGKSNISDAVRWVMGEQNVRQLRGQKSEDIIFAGTEKRRPAGAAEVSLYFDNTDHSLDIDFSEVVVTRRIFRSGESEFYINKRSCRLKDIYTLFADTGIGQDSMAVIGQNRVDRILNSKPEERRIIFEEVAGISRFKGRKAEGMRKIAETDRNLERIGDLMSMLEERLEPMEQQAEKLKQYRQLDRDRISYEGTLTLQELRNSERLLSKAENSRATAATEQITAAKELAAAEEKHQRLIAVMEQEGATLRNLDEAARQAHTELDSMKNRSEAFAQRQVSIKESLKEVEEEEQRLTKKNDGISRQRQDLQNQLSARQIEFSAAQKSLVLTKKLFGQAEEKATQLADELEEKTAAQSQRQQDLFTLRRDTDDLRRRLQENGTKCDETSQALAAKKEEAEKAAASTQQLEQSLSDGQQKIEAVQQAVDTAREDLKSIREKVSKAEDTYRHLRGTMDSLQQRIRVLESMEQDHEGIGRAAKVVLDAQTSWQTDICGIVGELCQIPSQYVTALDIALGAAARNIVTNTERTAKEAISYLKSRKAGRTTFLPLDTIHGRHRSHTEETAAGEAGILGFASDLIRYDKKYEGIFSSLLGRTLIADTMDTGSRVAGKYAHQLRIVCLDGTQFNVGGSLSGGAMKIKEGSLISRRALLEQLKEEKETNRQQLDALEQQGKEFRRQAEEAQQHARTTMQQQQQESLRQQQLELQMTAARKMLEDVNGQVDTFDRNFQALQQLRAGIQAALVEKEAAWEQLEQNQPEDTKLLEQAREAARKEADTCRQTLTEREVSAATMGEQVRHLEEQIQQQDDWQDQSQGDAQRLTQRRQALLDQQQETATLLDTLNGNIAVKEKDVAGKDQDKTDFYQTKESNFRHNKELDTALQDLRKREQDWSQRINTADIQIEKYHGEISHYEERLAQQGLTRQEALERRRDGSLRELHDTVTSLKEKIAALGQINPNAEEEYTAAAEQQQFYHKQCDDLEESKQKLVGVVDEIDAAMAEQFGQAFKEIAAHFQQIFSRLFGGGSAKITLTDTKDILASGVEIYIQPSGKKQQQLTLLSGGERALTVIALLLAFLAYHPAPFCLVDEVDAALDEANVERMARYLKNYSGNTQFIVITHRRKSMEAANTLQGVTMEEKGVSRLLTVKVDELIKEGT
ncbi:MAG: chromosome segregation protein SMC [Megasphaera sp.]|jgi:chromosome segregation protein|nr:chromosome segregation protein SMC [Megasphaera sp.]MCI1248136.1 chromosome segregation protein SMC [Megasphaera sp.]